MLRYACLPSRQPGQSDSQTNDRCSRQNSKAEDLLKKVNSGGDFAALAKATPTIPKDRAETWTLCLICIRVMSQQLEIIYGKGILERFRRPLPVRLLRFGKASGFTGLSFVKVRSAVNSMQEAAELAQRADTK